MLGLGRTAEPYAFITVELQESAALHPSGSTATFRVPSLRDSDVRGPWLLRSFDPVPSFHQTPNWDPELVAAVAGEASQLLEDEIVRTVDTRTGARCMATSCHGTYEKIVAAHFGCSTGRMPGGVRRTQTWSGTPSPTTRSGIHGRVARTVRRAFPNVSEAMAEAALFWTKHPNLRRPDSPMLSKGQIGDFTFTYRVRRPNGIARGRYVI